MIQDITPHVFINAFTPRPPRNGDYVLIYGGDKAYLRGSVVAAGGSAAVEAASSGEEADCGMPLYDHMDEIAPGRRDDLTFLFIVDEAAFFFLSSDLLSGEEKNRLVERPAYSFRTYGVKWLGFAGITACHLSGWYDRHKVCGRCGSKNVHSDIERMVQCPKCGEMYYPRISPAVIVGVRDGEKLLLTRYANRPGVNYALIAGFCEIGEPIEDTVRREVMEEVGVRVKNIRFYKSQPWGFSSSLLMGFYCDLDGSGEITLDKNELAAAEWKARGDISAGDTSISLTSEMIESFRTGADK
jgi:NAD+ diphosphatase